MQKAKKTDKAGYVFQVGQSGGGLHCIQIIMQFLPLSYLFNMHIISSASVGDAAMLVPVFNSLRRSCGSHGHATSTWCWIIFQVHSSFSIWLKYSSLNLIMMTSEAEVIGCSSSMQLWQFPCHTLRHVAARKSPESCFATHRSKSFV